LTQIWKYLILPQGISIEKKRNYCDLSEALRLSSGFKVEDGKIAKEFFGCGVPLRQTKGG
jgi:hypothetical protein